MEWASAKMWSRVMTMVVKNLNPHQMIHFYVDVVTTISTSMWSQKINPNFGPCQKKHDGKYCGCQSYLGLQETNKTFFCCLHHQIFHLKKIVIVIIVVCSQIVSTVAPINLNVVFSLSELHKRGREDLIHEDPLRCTTHDKKGLVFTVILFYPMFWSP